MEFVNLLKSVLQKIPLDSTEEASSSKKAKMAGKGVTVDEASETKIPCRSMSLDLNNFPNDPIALSPYNKTVTQVATRKETVERSIDTWMQEETKKNPANSDQIQRISQRLKEQINSKSGVVEGNLDFSSYIHLTSLPENLHVSGNLDLRGCTSLTSLPDNLTVGENLNLKGCTSLMSLSGNLTVNGYLNLSNCTSLTSLPENLTVGENLNLRGCISLTSLLGNFTVSDLYLEGCTSLTSLLGNITVSEDLYFCGCTSLTSLPENLTVGGWLSLRDCISMTSLPNNLTTVDGDLNLSGCISLTSLPDNLTVNRNLNLSGCTSLTSLPENLTVGENLNLSGCTSLTSLPENLTVGGDMNLSGCTRITYLSNNITSMGRTMDGNMRQVNLERSGLSLGIIQRLQQILGGGNAPGMQFIFSMLGTHSQKTFSSIAEGFDYWRKLTDVKNLTCPNLEKLTPNEAANFCQFLTRLIDTAEYQNVNTRPGLARRVLYFLAKIEKNEELREVACQLIYDGLSSCDDRIILALDNIDLLMLISAAYKEEVIDSDDSSGTALKALAKQIIMLEKVDKAADEHIKSLLFVDPIEVKLAFRLRLKEKLNLPISTQHMIFRNCALIMDEKIDAAGDKILQEYDESELEIFLRVWSPWKQHERSQDVTLYEALPEVYDKDLKISINTECPITLVAPAYPVLLKNTKYEYAALKKHYIDNGKNPVTSELILWRDVSKIVSTKT